MQLQFYKYQGTGNDFIMIDDRDNKFPTENVALVAKLCDRKFGIGADGLILLQNHNQASYYMKYYNSDGNESTMCGNGGRCLAAFALHIGVANGAHTFMAIDGLHDAEFEGELTDSVWIKLKMKDVDDIDARPENVFVLNTGSPHYVQFVYENLAALNLIDDAKHIRYGAEYAVEGINVNFINLLGLHH
ncbi:MAG: diaminopimelate epimerase, partial [Bacteroidia bacterium]|nr:diaminopimelate epimerase [Bacteroidia bacterium]